MKRMSLSDGVWIAALCLGVGLFAGCGGDEAAAVSTDEAAENMEVVFSDANEPVQQAANAAASAMRNNDYGSAYQSLVGLQRREDLTPEQGMVAMQSAKALRIQIATRAANGDTNAQAIARMINQSMSY